MPSLIICSDNFAGEETTPLPEHCRTWSADQAATAIGVNFGLLLAFTHRVQYIMLKNGLKYIA
jgi:hypothetical protein